MLWSKPNPAAGLYRSDDAGQTWALVNSQGALIQRPFYYVALGADPTNAEVVYAGAENFYKSTDGGRRSRFFAHRTVTTTTFGSIQKMVRS